MFFLGVCVAEDPANRAREEKKRFGSRQTASKQGTKHSDSYSRRIDLPRSNAVAREARTFAYVPLGRRQVDPPAVRITMVCSLFACRLSASEAFLSSLARFAGSSTTHTLRKNICWFLSWLVKRAGVTWRRRPLVDCATPPRHLSKKQKSKSFRPQQRTWLTQDLHLYARRTFHWLCGAYCSQNQPRVLRKWAMVSYAKDLGKCDRMLLQIEGLARVGENNDFWRSMAPEQQTYSWIWNVEPSWRLIRVVWG